eukprot:UN07753
MNPFGYTDNKYIKSRDETNILSYTLYITLFNDTFIYPTIEHHSTATWDLNYFQPKRQYDLSLSFPKDSKNDFDFGWFMSSLRLNLPSNEKVNYDRWEIDLFTNEAWLDPKYSGDCAAYWTDEECTETRECDSDGCVTKRRCWDIVRQRTDITMRLRKLHQFHVSYNIQRTGLQGYRKPYFSCRSFLIYNSFINDKLYNHYTLARVFDLRHYFIHRPPLNNVVMDWEHTERPFAVSDR